ncbi:Nucleoside H+ symporter [compost metagenome]
MATYGLGMLIGFWVAGQVTDHYATTAGSHDWKHIWLFPAGFALAIFFCFSLAFKGREATVVQTSG